MSRPAKTPIVGIVGWKNSGKTTLAERLIAEFTRRGLKVASIKHTHHDVEGDGGDSGSAATDSVRHRRAGARETVLAGPRRWVLVHEGEGPEPALDEIVSRLAPADVIVVEGYKGAAIPKIEVRRSAQEDPRPLAPGDPAIIAIAADHDVAESGVATFSPDDAGAIADFLVRAIGVPGRR